MIVDIVIPSKQPNLKKKFFKNFFPNLYTRKIKSRYAIYEVNTISLFEIIPPKNQTVSIN